VTPVHLVAFVVDPVDDDMADAVRSRVRAMALGRTWTGTPPGFFDDPAAEDPASRTMGTYLGDPTARPDDVTALFQVIQELSALHGSAWEIQLGEAIAGRLHAGRPDPALAAALATWTRDA
jgi:hypothetical protein